MGGPDAEGLDQTHRQSQRLEAPDGGKCGLVHQDAHIHTHTRCS